MTINGDLTNVIPSQITKRTVRDSGFKYTLALLGGLLLALFALLHGADLGAAPEVEPLPLIKPAEPTGTGLPSATPLICPLTRGRNLWS